MARHSLPVSVARGLSNLGAPVRHAVADRLPNVKRPARRVRKRTLLPHSAFQARSSDRHTLPVWHALSRPCLALRAGLLARRSGWFVSYSFAGRKRSADQVSSMDTWRTGCTPFAARAAASRSRLRSVPSRPPLG